MRETKSGKRLLPLVQLLPAVAVAGLVLVTVPRTAPVLAAVPERLAEAASEPAAEPAASSEEEAEGLTAVLPYADGVYTGSSRGFGGTVQVQVTMKGGHITDVQVLRAAHETSAFLRRAKRLLNTVLDAQTWEVDAVSEATYTSRGILGAIKNALTGEVVNNPLPPQTTPAAPPVEEEFTTPSAYRDGVYTASAEGFGGPITLQVTIADGVLADITVVSHDGETTSYFYKGRQVIATILETGTPEGVDAVSGATYSSTGILNAVKQALAKAANDAVPAETPDTAPADETPAEPAAPQYADGTYSGTGSTADGPVNVVITVKDGSVTDVQVLPTETEEPTFTEKVRAALEAFFSGKEQSASSGRVYTADELDAAVQDALQMALTTPETPAASEPEAPAESEPAAELAAESSPAAEPPEQDQPTGEENA